MGTNYGNMEGREWWIEVLLLYWGKKKRDFAARKSKALQGASLPTETVIKPVSLCLWGHLSMCCHAVWQLLAHLRASSPGRVCYSSLPTLLKTTNIPWPPHPTPLSQWHACRGSICDVHRLFWISISKRNTTYPQRLPPKFLPSVWITKTESRKISSMLVVGSPILKLHKPHRLQHPGKSTS